MEQPNCGHLKKIVFLGICTQAGVPAFFLWTEALLTIFKNVIANNLSPWGHDLSLTHKARNSAKPHRNSLGQLRFSTSLFGHQDSQMVMQYYTLNLTIKNETDRTFG